MPKSIIKKQAAEKLEQLRALLNKSQDLPASHSEIKEIQQVLHEAERIITIYEYLLAQSEIAPDFNVHLKIMEESSKLEKQNDEKINIRETVKEEIIEHKKIEETPEPVVEKKKDEQTPKEEPILKKDPEPPLQNIPPSQKPSRKLEISINDKFRMINELFHQNQQEYNIAIEQLNTVTSLQEANNYIAGLVSVYNWDEEKDIVKTLKRISQKRFL